MRTECVLVFLNFFCVLIANIYGEFERRIGKLESQTWSTHFALGSNLYPYQSSGNIPDFSPVGALISENGSLGTATLIAPDLAVTAAHVLKNRYDDPMPEPSNWEFILFEDFHLAPFESRHEISEILIHPDWIIRQSQSPPLGDGDKVGVDLALVRLKSKVTGVSTAYLPNQKELQIGDKIYISGFGNLVEGETGQSNSENTRRVAGENTLDRIVEEIVTADGKVSSNSGGLLAFDFDDHLGQTNRLGKTYGSFENLPEGESDYEPLQLEVSTAEGDSGGPLFARMDGKWRIFGTVSYGSSDSSYGDITVLSRLSNQMEWLNSHLPNWPNAKVIHQSGWRESDWFGTFFPFDGGWNYHQDFGWIWASPKSEDSVWIFYNHLKWLWVSYSVFPYFYSNENKNWIYFKHDTSSPSGWKIYRFANSTWTDYSN